MRGDHAKTCSNVHESAKLGSNREIKHSHRLSPLVKPQLPVSQSKGVSTAGFLKEDKKTGHPPQRIPVSLCHDIACH